MKMTCVSGRARRGKDTPVNLLREESVNQCQSVLAIRYADLLKYICRNFLDWDGKRDDAGHKLLQYVGADVVCQRCPDFWVSFLVNIPDLSPGEWDCALILGCRFPNEIKAMKSAGFDVMHLRVVRPNLNNPLTVKQQQRPSEVTLGSYHADYVTCDDGIISDLKYKLSNWLGGEQH